MEPTEPHGAAPSRVTRLAALGSVLLALAAMLILLAAPARAGSRGAYEAPARTSDAAPHALSVSQPMTYTTFLPLVARDYSMQASEWFGVQVYSIGDRVNPLIVSAGTGWIRIPLTWKHVEPQNTTPEHYQWNSWLDAEIAELSSQGVRTILTLAYNPSWAASYPGGPIDRADLSELVEFMQAAVAHYSVPPYNVKHFEFYNEPDNGDAYFASLGQVGYFGYTPEAYVELLSAVYAPMKQVDPGVQVVFGGIAYDAWDDPWGGPFVKTFLDEVLRLGGGAYFDVMNFHYYFVFAENWQDYGIDIVGKVNHLRDKLASYGVYKPFICTETGMLSNDDGGREAQALYVPQVFARARAVDLGIVIWFTLVDDDEVGAQLFGLLDPSYYPKPAYTAFQVAVDQLRRTAFVRTLRADGQMEVYEFEAPGERVLVAWSNDGASHLLALSGSELRRVDKFGGESVIRDGDDGLVDGIIRATIDVSAVYLRLAP